MKSIVRLSFPALWLGLLLLLGCSDIQGADCRADSDCQSAELCSSGRCLDHIARFGQGGTVAPGGMCQALKSVFATQTSCRLLVDCQNEATSGCGQGEIDKYRKFFACLQQSNLCADMQLNSLKKCGQEAGIQASPQCTFNIAVINATQTIRSVVGTPSCEQRRIEGTKGEVKVHLMLRDRDEIPYNLLDNTQPLKNDMFSIQKVEVLDQAGKPLENVSADVRLSTAPPKVLVNPRYKAARDASLRDDTLYLLQLLHDTSDESKQMDPRRVLSSAWASWILNARRQEQSIQPVADLFSLFSFGGNQASDIRSMISDPKDAPREQKYLSHAFYPLSRNNRESSSESLITSSAKVAGNAFLYDAIRQRADVLRPLLREGKSTVANPLMLVTSLAPDVHAVDASLQSKHDAALAKANDALKGSLSNDYIPGMFVTFPPQPGGSSLARWETHVERLCQLAQAAKDTNGNTWGQVFVLPPTNVPRPALFADQMHAAVMASHGYVVHGLQINVKGATKDQRLWVGVTIKVGSSQQDGSVNRPIWVEVRP